jgi:hypothetical protein
MSENAYAAHSGDDSPRSPEVFSLEAYIDRELERLSQGPTMSQWMAEVSQHSISGLTTQFSVDAIREIRDADDPREIT